MATVTKTTTAIVEGNIYFAGMVHWSDIEDMDTCGVGAGNASGATQGWLYTPICTDFGFALASTDVITKIEVLITGDENGTSYLDFCSLLYNGTASPVRCNHDDVTNPLDGTSHTATFIPTGSDLWGIAWTPAMVNDPTFGCAFDGWHSTGDLINIDCVRITITYTPNGEQPTGVCDGVPCDERMDLGDAIMAIIGKFHNPRFDCYGLKGSAALTKCTDLTDLSKCATRYTFEQALKSALVDDGCGGWALRVFVLPPPSNGELT